MRQRSWVILAIGLLVSSGGLRPHEGGRRNLKPTKAQADLNQARKQMDLAKKKLGAQGRYACCVKPSCDLCAQVAGSCACALNVAKGLGACGECYGGWQAGRGALKGVDRKSVKLLPAEKQGAPSTAPPPAELQLARDALLDAKRALAGERRFFCCIRGGCNQCAHEKDCPCGSDLASAAPAPQSRAAVASTTQRKGVCGDCLDGWHSGHGAFRGIELAEVQLALMDSMDAPLYASGTSLMPGAAPMDMWQRRLGPWNLMVHGVLFAVQSNQSGPRGRDKFFSANWFMPMLSRRLGPGTLTLRSMLSLEPATVTKRRYPLLFQTGETAYGIPIISGQHPHDFVMELGASYNLPLGERASLHFYGGPRGEPALGPTAFPHRASASENPMAVLSHHYQDSTHISSNVVTAGATWGRVTLEFSGFHGHEPDEKRWGLESGGIDSFSTRLAVSPSPRWTGQFSAGRINNREATHPVRDTFRLSSSLMYARPLAAGHWASTLVWGRNHDLEFTQPPTLGLGPLVQAAAPADHPGPIRHIVRVPTRIPGQIYNTFLAESTLFLANRHWIWGRAENADRDSLVLFEEAPFVRLVEEQRFARVQAYTAGYARELPRLVPWVSTALGGQFTYFGTPEKLRPVYGNHPVGVQVFLRLRLSSATTSQQSTPEAR